MIWTDCPDMNPFAFAINTIFLVMALVLDTEFVFQWGEVNSDEESCISLPHVPYLFYKQGYQ